MARVTQALTTGMKVLGGGNVSAFTLEHLSNSKKHPAGSFETIVVNYIELGRDGSNAISYGDDMPTVSRKHAAIERRGEDVVIKNLSTSNPTLVNGRPVKNEYFLNNGDEIQLSMEGPRLRFNRSASGTAKMGLTGRMNLVMQQSIKPYKTAVIGLAVMLVVIASGGGFLAYTGISKLNAETEVLAVRADSIASSHELAKAELAATIDSLKQANNATIAMLSEENKKLSGRLSNLATQNQQLRNDVQVLATAPANSSDELVAAYDQLKSHVYFMEISKFELVYPDGSSESIDYGWTCTGFVVNDGRFITARHCVQGWRFGAEETDIILNSLELAGVKMNITFRCTSPSSQLSFTYYDFKVDDSNDELIDLADYGMDGTVKLAGLDKYDWAYVKTSQTDGLMFDDALSKNMKAGSKVFALGFTNGFGGSDNTTSVSPLLGEATVAQNGVTQDGNISVTGKGWGSGNSGGPVLTKAKDGFKVVGIVSWSPVVGSKGDLGFLVPVDEVP